MAIDSRVTREFALITVKNAVSEYECHSNLQNDNQARLGNKSRLS